MCFATSLFQEQAQKQKQKKCFVTSLFQEQAKCHSPVVLKYHPLSCTITYRELTLLACAWLLFALRKREISTILSARWLPVAICQGLVTVSC